MNTSIAIADSRLQQAGMPVNCTLAPGDFAMSPRTVMNSLS